MTRVREVGSLVAYGWGSLREENSRVKSALQLPVVLFITALVWLAFRDIQPEPEFEGETAANLRERSAWSEKR